jgi:hypothetical protein
MVDHVVQCHTIPATRLLHNRRNGIANINEIGLQSL